MNNMRGLLILLLLVMTSFVFAFGGRERANVIQVTGVVRLVGSEPLPQVVITGSEYEWYIAREEISKLRDLQHQRVTVEGEETVRELTFAGGQSAGIRRELSNIRIISVH